MRSKNDLEPKGLKVENLWETPTFQAPRRGTWASTYIDVTLTKGLVTPLLDWRVSEEFNGSDHNMVLFSLDVESYIDDPGYSWHRADWTHFTKTISDHQFSLPENITKKEIDRMVQTLYAVINNAVELTVPKKGKMKKCLPYGRFSWYSEELQTKSTEVRSALAKLKKTPLPI